MATLRHGVVKQSLFWITRDSDTKDFVLLQVDLQHLEEMEDTKHPGIILNESTKLPNKPNTVEDTNTVEGFNLYIIVVEQIQVQSTPGELSKI